MYSSLNQGPYKVMTQLKRGRNRSIARSTPGRPHIFVERFAPKTSEPFLVYSVSTQHVCSAVVVKQSYLRIFTSYDHGGKRGTSKPRKMVEVLHDAARQDC